MKLTRPALALSILAAPLFAEEFDGVRADRILADMNFFRLVTCAAPPGGDCTTTVLRWPARDLRVILLPGRNPAEVATGTRIAPALDAAISEINRARSGVLLARTSEGPADIRIQPADIREGTILPDEPGVTAAGIMGVGYATLMSNENDEITASMILLSTDISDGDIPSVVLEELFQSLGPTYDVEGPAYEGVSILSQTSNVTTTIAGQDAALLRWLYPPKP